METKEPKIDKSGILNFAFSRPVVFPADLISEINSDYDEVIPKLTLTKEELAEISEVYKEA